MLWLNDREIAVSKEGWFVIGFGRDAKSKQQLRWQYINGEKGTLALTVKTRQYNIQRIEGVPQSRVTPNPDRLARIKQETGQVKAARKQYFEALYFNERFELPIKDARITGVYGSQRVTVYLKGRIMVSTTPRQLARRLRHPREALLRLLTKICIILVAP
jgi:hypothetical protein